jgi:preprotein translocase subunit SecY
MPLVACWSWCEPGHEHYCFAVHHCVLVGLVTYFVVFVERGQRKILVNYARRQVGNKVYGGQSSHLAPQAQYGGGDSTDFRVVNYFVAGDRCGLV